MNILISCVQMNHLSGSPMYHYELARALNKLKHNVFVVSEIRNPTREGLKLKQKLRREGIECSMKPVETWPEFDLHIFSQAKVYEHPDVNCKRINVVHSEYPWEQPGEAEHYVAIRQSIKDHWDLAGPKTSVIGNPIDIDRFHPGNTARHYDARSKSFKNLMLVPCTIDGLRSSFLQKVADDCRGWGDVKIIGDFKGGDLPKGTHVHVVKNSKFEIEEEYATATEVAGIHLGRVNLEAAAMGIPSRMYDPEKLTFEKFSPPLSEEYYSQNVAKSILETVQ